MNKPVPILLLEKYILDELDSEEKYRVESALKHNSELQKIIDNMIADNNKFDAAYPFNVRISRNRKLKIRPVSLSRLYFNFAFASIVILSVALFLLPSYQNQDILTSDGLEVTRLKGLTPALNIYRKSDNHIESLNNNTRVFKKDSLQLSYFAGNAKHGLIFSLDGNKQITLHFPNSKTESTALQNDGEVQLPYSYELDNAPDYEKFFFLTSDDPIDVSSVIRYAKIKLANNNEVNLLGSKYNLTTINLLKGEK